MKNIIIIIICVVLVGVFINIMAIEIWGLLPKSQVDDETVEQAIVRLIAEHEADSDSHLGEGESLETHKSQEVVDHPIGSIVADKQDLNEIKWEKTWDVQGAWYFSPGADVESYANLTLYVESGLYDMTEVYSVFYFGELFSDYNQNMMFRTRVYIDNNDEYEAFFGIYNRVDNLPNKGFGFYFDGTDVKGFWVNVSGVQYTDALGPSPIDEHSYAVIFDPTGPTLTFYIDGVIESTEDSLGTLVTGMNRFLYQMIRNASSDNTLRVADTLIAAGWD